MRWCKPLWVRDRILWNACHRLIFWMLIPRLVLLFWENKNKIKPWGGSLREELGHCREWGCAFEVISDFQSVLSMCLLSTMRWVVSSTCCHYYDVHHGPRISRSKDCRMSPLKLWSKRNLPSFIYLFIFAFKISLEKISGKWMPSFLIYSDNLFNEPSNLSYFFLFLILIYQFYIYLHIHLFTCIYIITFSSPASRQNLFHPFSLILLKR
jgi:hypothetical protein